MRIGSVSLLECNFVHLTEANSIAQCQVTVRCVQKFIVLTKTEGENKSGGENKGNRLGEIEYIGEENESGRRANTYVTSTRMFRSLSFEPDMVKDSAPVSSTPSKKTQWGEGSQKG